MPKVPADSLGRIPDDELRRPPTEMLQRIAAHLDERRLVGTRLLVAPPAVSRPHRGGPAHRPRCAARADDVRRAAVRALYQYLSPLTGGPDGTGWPFGRPVHTFDVSAVLAALPGVAAVEEVLIFPADLATGQAGRAGTAHRHRPGRSRPVLSAPGPGDMRGAVPGLASPHPLGHTLPGLYAEDSFAQRLCQGLDEMLAPVLATLDCLPAYLDPGTTPADLLKWLAGWVGMADAAELPEARRRELVAEAAQLYVWRGTPATIMSIVELTTGQTPEIVESGGTTWSPANRTRHRPADRARAHSPAAGRSGRRPERLTARYRRVRACLCAVAPGNL